MATQIKTAEFFFLCTFGTTWGHFVYYFVTNANGLMVSLRICFWIVMHKNAVQGIGKISKSSSLHKILGLSMRTFWQTGTL